MTHNHSAGSARSATMPCKALKKLEDFVNFRSNRNTKFKCDLFLHWFLRAFALLRWFTSPLRLIIEIIQILRSYKPPDFDIFKPKNVRDGACVPESNISMVY